MSTATATPSATLSASADVPTENVGPINKYRALEERTLEFARRVRVFTRKLPKFIAMSDDVRQLTRSSGAIGANYIEANEALGKKDFVMRIRICLKEAKESFFWLRLIDVGSSDRLSAEKEKLTKEADELMRIYCSIHIAMRAKAKKAREAKKTLEQ